MHSESSRPKTSFQQSSAARWSQRKCKDFKVSRVNSRARRLRETYWLWCIPWGVSGRPLTKKVGPMLTRYTAYMGCAVLRWRPQERWGLLRPFLGWFWWLLKTATAVDDGSLVSPWLCQVKKKKLRKLKNESRSRRFPTDFWFPHGFDPSGVSSAYNFWWFSEPFFKHHRDLAKKNGTSGPT